MPFFQGIALQGSEAAGAFVPATALANATLQAAATNSQANKQKRKRSKVPPPPLPEDILQWGRHIRLNEVCWMQPPDSPENFAHICILIQEGYGKNCMKFICS
jgi:hypothetical protein